MYNAPHHHDFAPVEETGLISRIALLVIYLFLGSLLSLTAATSVFASDSHRLDIDETK